MNNAKVGVITAAILCVVVVVAAAFSGSDVSSVEEARSAKIRGAFSVWDGSHIKLTRRIKQQLIDPASYEHVQTAYIESDGILMVRVVFRSKDHFGRTVLTRGRARVDLEGNILSFIKE